MDLSHLIRFQLAHSTWALEQLIAHARKLPSSAIDRDLGIGPGSLRENITHTVECMFFFADNFRARDYAERPDFRERARSLGGLAALLSEAGDELRAAMLDTHTAGMPDRIQWPSADSGTLAAAAAIAQVFDHAALHRTQCINMLKQLGVNPPPDLDPMTFQSTTLPW